MVFFFIYCFSEDCPLGVLAREENALLESRCSKMESDLFTMLGVFLAIFGKSQN